MQFMREAYRMGYEAARREQAQADGTDVLPNNVVDLTVSRRPMAER